jgi:Putative beta barrel porin-7 (BBP7)
MRKGFLGSLAVLAAGAGLTFGQSYIPPGAGGPPPGQLPGTLPPPGMTTGSPPPGAAPYAYSGPSGANAGYQYASPDGHPLIAPPGLEGMVPPGSMGAGAPGGAYDEPGNSSNNARGVLAGFLGGGGPARIWFGADYLRWVPKSMDVNYPFATTSAPADLGILGRATTSALLGADRNISFDASNGFRAWVGMSWDDAGTLGAELSGFWVDKQSKTTDFGGNSSGLPVLAVPFFDANAGAQGSYIISFPGINSGSIRVETSTRALGGELNCVLNLYPSGGDQPGGLVLLAGLRFWQLKETFSELTTSSTFGVPPGGVVPPGTLPPPAFGASFFPGAGGVFAGTFFGPALAPYTVQTTDRIQTRNDFYGANIGFRGDIGYGNWFLNLTGKFAAGYMRQQADVIGSSSLTTAGGLVSIQPGGLFSVADDLGRHHKDRFAILPEGGVSVGYQLCSWMKLSAGYTYMWTNTVIRPTNTITPVLNPNLIPVSPVFNGNAPSSFVPRNVVNESDFHLHGFTAGIEISF